MTKIRTGQIATTSEGWSTWTPSWTNLTPSNGTLTYAKYTQIGKTVFFKLKFVWGGSTSCSGTVSFSLPVTAHADEVPATGVNVIGHGNALDSGTNQFNLSCAMLSTTTAVCNAYNVAGSYANPNGVNATVPMTWAVNDCLTIRGYYEAA